LKKLFGMDYKVNEIRALAQRWLAGETTLAEERVLREWFAEVQREELPVDLVPIASMFGQSAQAAGERSHRKLVLHTEPAKQSAPLLKRSHPLRRWVAVASAAAAVVIAMVVIFTPAERAPQSDILCVVNGVQITDPDMIALHTREALKIADDNMQLPRRAISAEFASDPAMARVGEMLNELSKNQ
jgi:hypothetical protein